MSKRNLAHTTWALSALMDGKDRQHCLLLADLTGFRWVCSRVAKDDGTRATVYVVQRGPGVNAGNAIIKILNDGYYGGQPVFAMGGADGQTITISKDALLDTQANPDTCAYDIFKAIGHVVEDLESLELIARVAASSALTLKSNG